MWPAQAAAHGVVAFQGGCYDVIYDETLVAIQCLFSDDVKSYEIQVKSLKKSSACSLGCLQTESGRNQLHKLQIEPLARCHSHRDTNG